MQISLKLIQSINHAALTIYLKFQLLVIFSSLFTILQAPPVYLSFHEVYCTNLEILRYLEILDSALIEARVYRPKSLLSSTFFPVLPIFPLFLIPLSYATSSLPFLSLFLFPPLPSERIKRSMKTNDSLTP